MGYADDETGGRFFDSRGYLKNADVRRNVALMRRCNSPMCDERTYGLSVRNSNGVIGEFRVCAYCGRLISYCKRENCDNRKFFSLVEQIQAD